MLASAAQLDPVSQTLVHREMIYGSFSNNALISQKLKEILAAGDSYHKLDYTIVEALDMIASKLARIVNGKYHPDNFVDIAGYATLVLQENGSN